MGGHCLLLVSALILDLGLGSSRTTPATGLDQLATTGFLGGLDGALAPAGFDETRFLLDSRRLFGAGLEALLCAASRTTRGQVCLGGNPLPGKGAGCDDLAPIHPNLHANRTNGGLGRCGSVVDVGTQSVQRNTTLPVPLAAAHIGATETALALDPNTFGASLQRGRNGTLHSTTECDSVLDLVSDPPGEEGRIQIRVLDLIDVELDPAFGHLLQTGAKTLGLRALAPDHNSRAGSVNVDNQTVAGALDVYAGHGASNQLPAEILADLPIFIDESDVVLLREPLGLPVS